MREPSQITADVPTPPNKCYLWVVKHSLECHKPLVGTQSGAAVNVS